MVLIDQSHSWKLVTPEMKRRETKTWAAGWFKKNIQAFVDNSRLVVIIFLKLWTLLKFFCSPFSNSLKEVFCCRHNHTIQARPVQSIKLNILFILSFCYMNMSNEQFMHRFNTWYSKRNSVISNSLLFKLHQIESAHNKC